MARSGEGGGSRSFFKQPGLARAFGAKLDDFWRIEPQCVSCEALYCVPRLKFEHSRTDAGVPRGHRLLHRDRAARRIDDARKFHQHAVAGRLDDAAVLLGDLRIEELAAQRFEAFERAFLIRVLVQLHHSKTVSW